MKCPNCSTVLAIADRHGVEIDYCPSCRGVWLDRGELDKLLDFAQRAEERHERDDDLRRDVKPPHDYDPRKHDSYRPDLEDSDDRRPRYDGRYQQPYPKKRESFWSNLFDFD